MVILTMLVTQYAIFSLVRHVLVYLTLKIQLHVRHCGDYRKEVRIAKGFFSIQEYISSLIKNGMVLPSISDNSWKYLRSK